MKLRFFASAIALTSLVAAPAFADKPTTDANIYKHTVDSKSAKEVRKMEIMNRNQDNLSADTLAFMPDWYKRFTVSGVVKVNAAYADNPGFGGGSSAYRLSLATVEFYLDAVLNHWARAHMTLDYDFDTTPGALAGSTFGRSLYVSEATITLADFLRSPFYLVVGRQYLPFGSTVHNTISAPMGQDLAIGRDLAVTAGFVSDTGFYTDIYGFQGVQLSTGKTTINGYGANLGFKHHSSSFGYNVNVGYINNLANSNFIRPLLAAPNTSIRALDGVSLHGDLNAGSFDLHADYTVAATDFRLATFFAPPALTPIGRLNLAPWAYDVEGDYHFMVYGHHSLVGVSWQQSGNASFIRSGINGTVSTGALGGFVMPHYRIAAVYKYEFLRNVFAKLGYRHDVDYKVTDAGGTGGTDNSLILQLGMGF